MDYDKLTEKDKERIIINRSCALCHTNVELNVPRFRAVEPYQVLCWDCMGNPEDEQ